MDNTELLKLVQAGDERYLNLADRLRNTKSRSKRELLDMAADAITALLKSRNRWRDFANDRAIMYDEEVNGAADD